MSENHLNLSAGEESVTPSATTGNSQSASLCESSQQPQASAETTNFAHSNHSTPMLPVPVTSAVPATTPTERFSDVMGSPTATATAAWALSNLCHAPSMVQPGYTAPSTYHHWPQPQPQPQLPPQSKTPYASSTYPSYPPLHLQHLKESTSHPSGILHHDSPSMHYNHALLPSADHTTPDATKPISSTDNWHSIPPSAVSYHRYSANNNLAPFQQPQNHQPQHQQLATPFPIIEPRPPSPTLDDPTTSESSKRKAIPNSLVTPTPIKKAHVMDYSRKTKSLGLLCENFINRDWPNGVLSIDDAARELEVERRRIYDIVNILESLEVVTKIHKNTYQWKGLVDLESMIGRLQQEALVDFADLGYKFGLLKVPPSGTKRPEADAKKSLGKLSRQFLQLFLVGCPSLSLHDASDLILGVSTVEDLSRMGGAGTSSSPKSTKAAATKGLKTKIRRLYDIANILCSLGLVRKLGGQRSKHVFVWAYSKSVEEVMACHTPSSPKEHEASNVLAHLIADKNLARLVTLETKDILAHIHEHGACEAPCLVRSVTLKRET